MFSEVRWSARAMVPTAGGIEVGSCEAIKGRGKVLVGWPRRLRRLVGEEMSHVAHWWGGGGIFFEPATVPECVCRKGSGCR